mmetsp:Transcript_29083/g.86082  ORF Transcript_29083/g.86082 Transcript_29083/m.86082 type:complete len:408 (+) Transcript_29083:187-1410(+)
MSANRKQQAKAPHLLREERPAAAERERLGRDLTGGRTPRSRDDSGRPNAPTPPRRRRRRRRLSNRAQPGANLSLRRAGQGRIGIRRVVGGMGKPRVPALLQGRHCRFARSDRRRGRGLGRGWVEGGMPVVVAFDVRVGRGGRAALRSGRGRPLLGIGIGIGRSAPVGRPRLAPLAARWDGAPHGRRLRRIGIALHGAQGPGVETKGLRGDPRGSGALGSAPRDQFDRRIGLFEGRSFPPRQDRTREVRRFRVLQAPRRQEEEGGGRRRRIRRGGPGMLGRLTPRTSPQLGRAIRSVLLGRRRAPFGGGHPPRSEEGVRAGAAQSQGDGRGGGGRGRRHRPRRTGQPDEAGGRHHGPPGSRGRGRAGGGGVRRAVCAVRQGPADGGGDERRGERFDRRTLAELGQQRK